MPRTLVDIRRGLRPNMPGQQDRSADMGQDWESEYLRRHRNRQRDRQEARTNMPPQAAGTQGAVVPPRPPEPRKRQEQPAVVQPARPGRVIRKALRPRMR